MIEIDAIDTHFEIYENNYKIRYLHHQTTLVQVLEYNREPTIIINMTLKKLGSTQIIFTL